jgi:hypothetical protein
MAVLRMVLHRAKPCLLLATSSPRCAAGPLRTEKKVLTRRRKECVGAVLPLSTAICSCCRAVGSCRQDQWDNCDDLQGTKQAGAAAPAGHVRLQVWQPTAERVAATHNPASHNSNSCVGCCYSRELASSVTRQLGDA